MFIKLSKIGDIFIAVKRSGSTGSLLACDGTARCKSGLKRQNRAEPSNVHGEVSGKKTTGRVSVIVVRILFL